MGPTLLLLGGSTGSRRASVTLLKHGILLLHLEPLLQSCCGCLLLLCSGWHLSTRGPCHASRLAHVSLWRLGLLLLRRLWLLKLAMVSHLLLLGLLLLLLLKMSSQ